jgi:hypothetical protein
MRTQRIELFRYKPFLFNEVELLEIDMPSSIQNVIGTNGSGKTSLLQEINPRPATRTDFGENGYKKITILHENSEYVLTSDFSKDGKAHSFVKDGEELNESGATSVQDELVAGHLGYTTQVHNVSYGTFPLSRMQVGTRKTYLLTSHPCQMKLILDKHKKVTSALRDCRSNLAMMHERRAALVTQLLDESVKADLEVENSKLENELAAIVDAMHRLTNQKANIQKSLDETGIPYATKSHKEIISTLPRYAAYSVIPRDMPIDALRNITINDLSVITAKLENLETRARDLTLEIDKYEQHIRQNDAKGALDLLETSIATLMLDISDLEKQTVANPFDNYVIEKIPEQISYLTDLISFFIGYGAPIPALREVQKLREKLYRTKSKKYGYDQEEAHLKDQLLRNERILSEKVINNIPKSCCGCVLFQNYQNSISGAQSDYSKTTEELRLIQSKTKRWDLVFSGRSEKLALWEIAAPQLQKINDFMGENRYLLTPLKDIDLLQTIRKNPSSIIVRIQSHYNLSVNYHLLQKKKGELNRLLMEQEKMQAPSEFGQKFLEQMVVEKHAELDIVRREHAQYIAQRSEKSAFLKTLESYFQDVLTAKRDLENAKSLGVFKLLQHEKDACDLYLSNLANAKLRVVDRLTEINRILREQNAIQARYRDEVMVNIEKLTINEAEYTQLEKALSPTVGLPHRYMVQFLNDILTDANLFLSEIWSYPIEFVLFDEDANLDYKFRMKVRDVPIPDISEGSEGQSEIADFAFNLALAIQLKQSGYPLMLDECGRTFDAYHKQRLVEFLKTIVDDDLVSQLFLINHHATISAGLLNSDTIVLNSDNIVVPEVYNEYVKIEKY